MACSDAIINASMRYCTGITPIPPARDWYLADVITNARIVPGKRVQVKLESLNAQDSMGRYAHVRGLYFAALGVFTIAGATNAPVSAHQLRSVFQSLNMSDVTKHLYWPSIDARVVMDDQFFRIGMRANGAYLFSNQAGTVPFATGPQTNANLDIPEDAGAGEYVREISFHAPFVVQRPDGRRGEGLIPLAALQREGVDSIYFTLANAIAGAPAGIAFTGTTRAEPGLETTDGMSVWADIVYLDKPQIDRAWTIDSYTLTEQSGSLLYGDRTHEYVEARYFPEDNGIVGGDISAPLLGHNGITLTAANWTVMPGMENGEAQFRGMLEHASLWNSSPGVLNQPAGDLPYFLSTVTPGTEVSLGDFAPQSLELLPYRVGRKGSAAGILTFKYAQRPFAYTRYFHRTSLDLTPERVDLLTRAIKCNPCSAIFQTDGNGTAVPAARIDGSQPVLIVPTGTANVGPVLKNEETII